MPEALRESQLLLAEIYSEGEDFKQAVALYKPLIDDILKDSNKPFDETALRIFDGAGQAYLQLGDVENVAAVGAKFVELGPDQGPVNVRDHEFRQGAGNPAQEGHGRKRLGRSRRAKRGRGEAEVR